MMSTKIKATFASLGVAALLMPAVAGAGGDGKKFSRADFERCNQRAMQIAGVETDSPAALPGASQPGTQPSTQPGTSSGSGTTGSGVSSGTGTSGSGVSSGTGTSGSGVSSGTGTTGSGVSSGTGTMGAGTGQELDRVVDAYRDCLQQAKQSQ